MRDETKKESWLHALRARVREKRNFTTANRLRRDMQPCGPAECAKLDQKFENALAEEGLGQELEAWHKY